MQEIALMNPRRRRRASARRVRHNPRRRARRRMHVGHYLRLNPRRRKSSGFGMSASGIKGFFSMNNLQNIGLMGAGFLGGAAVEKTFGNKIPFSTGNAIADAGIKQLPLALGIAFLGNKLPKPLTTGAGAYIGYRIINAVIGPTLGLSGGVGDVGVIPAVYNLGEITPMGESTSSMDGGASF